MCIQNANFLFAFFSIQVEFDVLTQTIVRSGWDRIRTVRRSDEDCGRMLLLLSLEASSRPYILTFRLWIFPGLIILSGIVFCLPSPWPTGN